MKIQGTEGLEKPDKVICPTCDSLVPKALGKLEKIEGLIELNDPGCLFACTVCGLFFRYPYLDEHALQKAYSEVKPGTWQYGKRQDFVLAARLIGSLKGVRSVLDVGCFRGDFLAALPDNVQKYGIEPSSDVQEAARKNGVRIVANTIESIGDDCPNFDVISMIDVIEHLPRPLDALKKLAHFLNPGGYFVISTGNTNALPWKMMRLNYWYYFPEHVCFFNAKWFSWAGNQLGLSLTETQKFAHDKADWIVRVRQFAFAGIYQLYARLGSYPTLRHALSQVYPFSRAANATSTPKTRAWKDHFLVCLQRQEG